MTDTKWIVGIDGGGTRCRARLESADGHLITETEAGPANVAQNAEQAYRSVLQVCEQVLQYIPQEDITAVNVVAGLAGLNIDKYAAIARQWALPFDITYTTDLHIACAGAHLQQTGALIITGTGSSAYVKTASTAKILGGHGFPLGDEASGAWLGWQALQCALHSLDGLIAPNKLTQETCTTLGLHTCEALVAHCLHFRSVDYAALAPLVIKQATSGEPVSKAIMQKGSEYLTRLFTRIQSFEPGRVAMTGGLAPLWRPWLHPNVQAGLAEPLATPTQGAIWLARSSSTSLLNSADYD